MEEQKDILQVDVSGKDPDKWKRVKGKLLDMIEDLLDMEADAITKSKVRDELNEFRHKLLQYGKSKLDKAKFDNDKTLAEVEELFSKRDKNLAEARKLNAEAEAQELENKLTRLKMALGLAAVVARGENGEDSVVFIRDVEQFMAVLEGLKGEKSKKLIE